MPKNMNADLILIGKRTIQKEVQALTSLLDQLDENFAAACETIFKCQGTIITTGMGKSGLVARKWAASFSGTGTKSYFLNAAEASHGDLGILHGNDVLVALSFSGETQELSPILRYARELEIPTIGVTGDRKSSLARQSSILLGVDLAEEACPLGLAPTSSTTVMMALGDAVAMTLMQMRGFTEKDFARLHPGGSLGRKLWLRVEELMHKDSQLPTVAENDSLDKVLKEISAKHLGLAVVMENKKIVGVITDGDLRRASQAEKISTNATARDIMSKHPKRISHKALVVEAREIMEQFSITQLLIVDENDELLGVLHLHDLLKAKAL